MENTLAFVDSCVKLEFSGDKYTQKIMLDILTKHTQMDLSYLALILNSTVNQLNNIYNGNDFLDDAKALDLAHIFLIFLGQNFFRKSILIRTFL